MSDNNITLEGIANVIREELKPVNERLTAVEETLGEHTKLLRSHTDSLEKLLTKKKVKDDESTIRLARFERALKQVGEHLGLKLEL
jgi:thymidylate synthase ThyX